MSHASAWRFWLGRRLSLLYLSSAPLYAACSSPFASSTLSLKTSHCDVFACLRQARSPSNPAAFSSQKKHPQGVFFFWLGRRLSLLYLSSAPLYAACSSPFASSTLSLKTSHCDVFACLRQARSPSNPAAFSSQKKHPQGVFFFWLGRRDSNPRMTESKSVALPLGDGPLF